MLALVLACGTAHASDWVLFGKTAYHQVFVDVSSIEIVGSIRRAWFKFVDEPNAFPPVPAGDGKTKVALYQQIRFAFDCAQEASRIEANFIYYDDGSVVPHPYSPADPWTPIPPESIESSQIKFICAWKSK